MGDDGFWIEADDVAPGTPLTCRYTAGAASQQIDVRFQPQPGGQFIYTGARPTSVSVVMSGAGIAPGLFAASPMSPTTDFDDDGRQEMERRRLQQEEEERRRRMRNNPPAY